MARWLEPVPDRSGADAAVCPTALAFVPGFAPGLGSGERLGGEGSRGAPISLWGARVASNDADLVGGAGTGLG
ncbi:MAG TPA: hypothetical protein VEH29_04685 [Acidimicrobiales bacterium]|nr:hypothetical protein [Acidimicrobiales bacterium]